MPAAVAIRLSEIEGLVDALSRSRSLATAMKLTSLGPMPDADRLRALARELRVAPDLAAYTDALRRLREHVRAIAGSRPYRAATTAKRLGATVRRRTLAPGPLERLQLVLDQL